MDKQFLILSKQISSSYLDKNGNIRGILINNNLETSHGYQLEYAAKMSNIKFSTSLYGKEGFAYLMDDFIRIFRRTGQTINNALNIDILSIPSSKQIKYLKDYVIEKNIRHDNIEIWSIIFDSNFCRKIKYLILR